MTMTSARASTSTARCSARASLEVTQPAGSGAAHRPTECKILPLPELGQVAVFILGETVRVYAFAEPAGGFRLRSGKCVMTGMSRDEVTTFLLSVRATFNGWEGDR
jgi:hypothetical protein